MYHPLTNPLSINLSSYMACDQWPLTSLKHGVMFSVDPSWLIYIVVIRFILDQFLTSHPRYVLVFIHISQIPNEVPSHQMVNSRLRTSSPIQNSQGLSHFRPIHRLKPTRPLMYPVLINLGSTMVLQRNPKFVSFAVFLTWCSTSCKNISLRSASID